MSEIKALSFCLVKFIFDQWKMQQAIILDKWRYLQQMQPYLGRISDNISIRHYRVGSYLRLSSLPTLFYLPYITCPTYAWHLFINISSRSAKPVFILPVSLHPEHRGQAEHPDQGFRAADDPDGQEVPHPEDGQPPAAPH